MPAGRDDDAIERALEQLLRLNASRKVHARQVAAAGVRISAPGLTLLRRIQEEGPLSLGELARRTEMDPAATGRQIRQLEDEGFVQRDPSADDGRVTVVRVTPAGREARRRIGEVVGDPVLGTTMGIAGRERAVREFGWDIAARRTVDIYRAVLDG